MTLWSWFGRRAPTPPAGSFRHLRAGECYRVIRAFRDFDGIAHPAGERWTFLRSTFLPYEDGLSLFVTLPDGPQRQIRLQGRAEAQGPIIDDLPDYIAPDHALMSIHLTRDSVCMADDIDAPHEFTLDLDPATDARGLAERLLGGNHLAYVGRNATWTLALGADHVVFGLRHGRRFVMRVDPETAAPSVAAVDRVHVGYAQQQDPDIVAQRIREGLAGAANRPR